MNSVRPQASVFRFGVFEVNLETGELRKSGVRLKLQTLPFKALVLLLRHPGELVSREELQRELWGSATNVDFEHGLGTAINKLRDALSDSSTAPRYVETLARRGYRFIAPVTELPTTTYVANGPETSIVSEVLHAPEAPAVQPRRSLADVRVIVAACLFTASLGAFVTWWIVKRSPGPAELVRIRQVTWSGRVYPGDPSLEAFANVVTDGIRLYFPVLEGGKFTIASAPLAFGEINSPISTLSTPAEISLPTLADISPDGSKLLVEDHTWSALESPLWLVPSAGGAAHRISNIFAHDATWMPDGQSILYAYGHELWVTHDNGDEPKLYARLPGRGFWPRWSPDASRLRLTIVDGNSRAMSLWEVRADTRRVQPVFQEFEKGTAQCCGAWTSDGRSYVFESTSRGTSDIWMQREDGRFPANAKPVQLTAGPLRFAAPVPSGRSGQLFVIGVQSRARLNRFNARTRRFQTYLPGLSTAARVSFSPDASRVAWISTSDGSLWQSRPDGTQRLQLTSPPFQVYLMTWSPDQQTIAIMGKHPGEPWKLYTIPAQGGNLKMLLTENRNEADPSWSPDGKQLAYGRSPEYMGEESTKKAIYLLDMTTGRSKELPGSIGLFSPRWSPDGRFLAALPLDQRNLELFDFAKSQWTVIANSSADNPVWTKDSKYLFFDAFMEDEKPIYRIDVGDRRIERVTDLRDMDSADALNYSFSGLSDDGMPVVSLNRWAADIYSIQAGRGGL